MPGPAVTHRPYSSAGPAHGPVVPERAPRVLGVDEFAFGKGWRYGTVLVDIEAARVVDVLPDRDAASFATWLREHPGAEIICRDRAPAYSSAVREAVPEAQEVADRWHLLHNLSSAVEKTCHQHRSCLRKQAEADRDAEPRRIINPLPPPTLPPTKIAVRTVDRYSAIHRLLGQGHSVSEIARRLHLDRKTVRRFRDTDLDELLASARHGRPKGVLEPFTAYLTERFTGGATSPTDLFHEIRSCSPSPSRGQTGAAAVELDFYAEPRRNQPLGRSTRLRMSLRSAWQSRRRGCAGRCAATAGPGLPRPC